MMHVPLVFSSFSFAELKKEWVAMEVDTKSIEEATNVNGALFASLRLYADRPLLGERLLVSGSFGEYEWMSYEAVYRKICTLAVPPL